MKAFLAALGAVPTLVLGAGAIAAETSSLATLRDAKGAEVGTVQVRETASGTVWLTLSATAVRDERDSNVPGADFTRDVVLLRLRYGL